mgnify:CR=1 FL=1
MQWLLKRRNTSLFQEQLLEFLHNKEERPWNDYKGNKPLKDQDLAKILRPYGIQPETRRRGDKTPRGYDTFKLDQVISRYL